ncbi:MAG: hypothetical protein WBO44_11450, partial [Saprospiraceae bacterium]
VHHFIIIVIGDLRFDSISTKHGAWAKKFAEMANSAVYEWSIIKNILKGIRIIFLVFIFIYV